MNAESTIEPAVDVSVVVCTYNRSAFVKQSIESLFHLRDDGAFTYDIVVVDDASTDDTRQVLDELTKHSPVPMRIVCGIGAGIAAARNLGIANADGVAVAFFDDDQIADRRWLVELWQTRHATAAVCVGGARVLDLPQPEIDRMSPITRAYLGEIPFEAAPRRITSADLFCTGTVMVDQSVFAQVGTFDESLTEGGEDTDFFTRVRHAGLECWYTPYSIVRHMVPPYRKKSSYLMWAAGRGGESFARRDAREMGAMRALCVAIARVGQAMLVHIPMFLVSIMRWKKGETLARVCQIRRALAYARRALLLALPKAADLGSRWAFDFRKERDLFSRSGQ